MYILWQYLQDKEKDRSTSPSPQGKGQQGGAKDPAVQGFFSQYIPRPGVQYYRDLAGNIKQVRITQLYIGSISLQVKG